MGEDRAISFGINVRRLRLTTLLRISICQRFRWPLSGQSALSAGGAAYCADALRRRPSLLPAASALIGARCFTAPIASKT
ncbi:hypothetical protein J4734_07220 [Klebsiella pneumoniae]|uniref:Uncharacterized protein n=1 Tax=Klebsiella pneumoniae TaxID=573 RepID=A0A939NR21_KLEPN|nr:hypothetical protein [Klebsiella pneumoniae]